MCEYAIETKLKNRSNSFHFGSDDNNKNIDDDKDDHVWLLSNRNNYTNFSKTKLWT